MKYAAILIFFLFPRLGFSEVMDAQYGNWAVFSNGQNNNKLCYIVGEAATKEGAIENRGHPYITVSYFSENQEEVSVSAGYFFKKDAVKIKFYNMNEFNLLTKAKLAWPLKEEDDKKIIALMLSAKEFVVEGSNAKEEISKDRYLLAGFQKAYDRMKKKCGEKFK